MISLEELVRQYPQNLQHFKKRILAEYLQCQILQIIFNTKYANKLSFLGGTALRIMFDNNRFSEDLDFDNFGLTQQEFKEIIEEIVKKLILEGYQMEMRIVFKGAYRCYLKFNDILFTNGVSKYENEKLTIQIDTAPHNFNYKPDIKILNKFDILTEIFVTPIDILFSQKICAAFGRKRLKGRDFYDLLYIFGINKKINYDYLQVKLGITDAGTLKKYILKKSKALDLKALASDVQPLLFNPEDHKKVLLFKQYIEGLES